MGDIPIFVAYDWCEQGLFELDAEGRQTVVAGVPPDYFSATGQRWGNPLYRWDVMARDGYQWWKKRIHALLSQVDYIRIDHFRGFESYWEIPASEATAERGRWVKGPGIDFFHKINAAFPGIKIVAEDLGGVTQEVVDLLEGAGLPGMRIMQFGFTDDNPNFLPHTYIPHCVAYTGTHDNNTTRGWFNSIPEHERNRVFEYFGKELSEDKVVAAMVKAIWESKADMVLIPLQDALNLGEECRMNFPGKNGGNWAWRYRPGQLSGQISAWLAGLTEACAR